MLKGTEPKMSVLAGSDWDEDGIKASPGVAGVCSKAGIKHSNDMSAAASAAHTLLCMLNILCGSQFCREKKEKGKRMERCSRDAVEIECYNVLETGEKENERDFVPGEK